MFLLPSMVSVSGLLEPLASPLQPTNALPGLGVAVSVTVLPASYVGRSGFPVAVPLPAVVRLSVNCWTAPIAKSLKLVSPVTWELVAVRVPVVVTDQVGALYF